MNTSDIKKYINSLDDNEFKSTVFLLFDFIDGCEDTLSDEFQIAIELIKVIEKFAERRKNAY